MDDPYMQHLGNGLPVEHAAPQQSPYAAPLQTPVQNTMQDPAQIPQPYAQPYAQPMQQPMMQQPMMQMATKYCKYCASQIPMDAVICTVCGRQVEMLQQMPQQQAAQPQQIIINNANNNVNTNINGRYGGKRIDKTTALLLCIFLGYLGAHKFYEGKAGTGLLYLFTGGLCGVGWLIDIFAILGKSNPYYV